MEKLIESDRSPYSEPLKGELLSFARLLEEPDPVTRVDPVKPPDPEPEPERVPDERLDPIICGSADCLWVVVDPPTDDPLGPTHNRFRTDGEYLPIVKVAPVYPRRAAARGIEGYVLVEFTVTATGSVRDPLVVEAKPPGVFDRAATDAALKFKYKPKVLNGEGMDVQGVRNLIRFELEHG